MKNYRPSSIVRRPYPNFYARLAMLGFLLGAMAYLLLSGNPWAWLANNRSHVALLKLHSTQNIESQQSYLAAANSHYAELTVASGGNHAYLLAQLELAPIASCPALGIGNRESGVGSSMIPDSLSGDETLELARWIETNSIIPICLAQKQLDNGAAYYDLVNKQFPQLEQAYDQLPVQMAKAFVLRAYERYGVGQVEPAQSDWTQARSYWLGGKAGAFEELAEQVAGSNAPDVRRAQQHLLADDLARDPENTELRIALAQAHNATFNSDEALAIIAPLLKTHRDDTRVWQQYGQALITANRLEEAEDVLREAVRLAPDDLQALNRLGVLLQGIGRSTEAAELFQRALKAEGGDKAYWVWEHLGDALLAEGKRADAATAYKQAVASAPADAQTSARDKLKALGGE